MRALRGQNLVPLKLGGIRTVVNRADRQLGAGVMGVGYGDGVGGILHIAELSKYADCMT